MAEDPTNSASDGIEISIDASDSSFEVEGRSPVASTQTSAAAETRVSSHESAPSAFEGTTIDLGLDLLEAESPKPSRLPAFEPQSAQTVPAFPSPQRDALTPSRNGPSPEIPRERTSSLPAQSEAFPTRLHSENLRAALDSAWTALRLGDRTGARARFRKIAVHFPECQEAFAGLSEIQEFEIQELLKEGVFVPEAQPASVDAEEPALDSSQLFVPQAKKEAADVHAAELADWSREKDRIQALDRVEAWLRTPEEAAQQSEVDLLLARMEAESSGLEVRTRLDLGIALFELGLFGAVERWLSPLTQLEEVLRLDAGVICAEAALADHRPWDAARHLDPLVLAPEFSGSEKIAVFYLRALAALKLNQETEALRFFREVCSLEGDYRDAQERLRVLEGFLKIKAEERLDRIKKGEIREDAP